MNEWVLLAVYVISLGGIGILIYVLFQNFFNDQEKRYQRSIQIKNYEVITPLRIQAYERMILFLERNSIDQLVMRYHQPGLTVRQLQQYMVKGMNAEFEHNLTQQLYLSSTVWKAIKTYKDETIALINNLAEKTGPEKPALELAGKLLELNLGQKKSMHEIVVDALKEELRQLYF